MSFWRIILSKHRICSVIYNILHLLTVHIGIVLRLRCDYVALRVTVFASRVVLAYVTGRQRMGCLRSYLGSKNRVRRLQPENVRFGGGEVTRVVGLRDSRSCITLNRGPVSWA